MKPTTSTAAIAMAMAGICTTAAPGDAVDLAFNWDGLVHLTGSDPDDANGYRSIANRGLTIFNLDSLGGIVGTVTEGVLNYNLTLSLFTLDTVYIGGPRNADDAVGFDDVEDGDDTGVAPNWDPTGGTAFVDSATTTIDPVEITPGFMLGFIYNASGIGGTDFDLTLGFASGLELTVTMNAPNWLADNDGMPSAPGLGVAHQQLLLGGTLSGGDGYQGANRTDRGFIEAPLNVVEGIVTYGSLVELGTPILGEDLTSITFGNVVGSKNATVGIYAADLAFAATGACCFFDGTCTEGTEVDCTSMGGLYQGDGTSCATADCPENDSLIVYNWNAILHDVEPGDPDAALGYRAIADRGLTFGNVDSLGGIGGIVDGVVTYTLSDFAFAPDAVYLGGPRADGAGGFGFDDVDDTDNIGIPPAWDPSGGTAMVDSVSSVFEPVTITEGFTLGLLYNATTGGGTFDVTLGFISGTELTVTLHAPDWFANNNGAPDPPGAGVAVQHLLDGPLSGGDGFDGAAGTDAGTAGSPLNVVEAVLTYGSLLELGTPILGDQLNTLTFDDVDGQFEMTVGIYAVEIDVASLGACCLGDGTCMVVTQAECAGLSGLYQGDATSCGEVTCPTNVPLPLNYNWNGMVHAEAGTPDAPDGFRSISDRGLSMGTADSLGGFDGAISAAMNYQLVDGDDTVDTVFIGGPRDHGNGGTGWDNIPDGDAVGVAPAWDPSGGNTNVESATTTLLTPVTITEQFALGFLYNSSVGGGFFDVTLGFLSGSQITARLHAPDWFANFDGAPNPPAAGVASQELLPGPLSGGDGFDATASADSGTPSAPLNVIEAVLTYDSLSALGNILGEQLITITFDNTIGGATQTVGIYAASISTVDDQPTCDGDANGDGMVSTDDLLGVLANWGAADPMWDVDGDGLVNVGDILIILANWGPCE